MDSPFQKIMILAPHADDCAIGCGGLLASLNQAEKFQICLSLAEDSLPKGFNINHISQELHEENKILECDYEVHTLPVRCLPSHPRTIARIICEALRNFTPDVVLCPHTKDYHQDHQAVTQVAARIFRFRQCAVLGYEGPNSLIDEPGYIVPLTEDQIHKKTLAINCYKSQRNKHPYVLSVITALAELRGWRQVLRHAEAYEIIKWTP